MRLSFLHSRGFEVKITKHTDTPRTLYKVTLSKFGDEAISLCTTECLEKNIEMVYQDVYTKFGDGRKRPNKKDRAKRCYHCRSTNYLEKIKRRWVCEKCAIFVD